MFDRIVKCPLTRGLASAALALLGYAIPASAVSLSTMDAPRPTTRADDRAPAQFEATDVSTTGVGGSTLVPMMAADLQARQMAGVDAPADAATPLGKPIDDVQFVRHATESGRQEANAARVALAQLRDPALKQLAARLVAEHGDSNERLSRIAEAKGWPLPGPRAAAASAPSASGANDSDFDAAWTAELIAGHERSVALYRAQATGGEDEDLRKYAKDTLPTIENHLAELRRLQK